MNQAKFPKLKLISIITAVILLAAAITIPIVNFLTQPRDSLDITNFSAYNLPPSYQINLETQIHRLLTLYFDAPTDEAIIATIRDDTYSEDSTAKITSATFIVDVDDYQQTYRVDMQWRTDGEDVSDGIIINCVPSELSKYPDTPCYGMYTTSDSIEIYLPYTTELPSGQTVTATFNYYTSDGTPKILITVNSCGIHSLEEFALTTIKNWLTTIGFDPAGFSYKISSQYINCEVN